MSYVVHYYIPARTQSNVYDYEGWAHSRSAYWASHTVKGDLEAARAWAREHNCRSKDGDHIVDQFGIRYEIDP